MVRAAARHDVPLDPPSDEPSVAAKVAGLYYISDSIPGISRRRCGRGFIYLTPDGQRIRGAATMARIKQLVIPPAWQEVWIAPFAHAHIQAVGRDDRGRKQYIYHPEWIRIRDAAKFDRMVAFSEALPEIRSRTDRDLRRQNLPKEKVLATVVRLLDSTYVRIGNMQYAKENASFGLTTLRNRHVEVSGANIRFEFRGKRGIEQRVDIHDKRLARIIRQCLEIPGYTLFQYYDEEGKRQPIDSGDVNAYLHEIAGGAFTAKDFRTWGGTLEAMLALLEIGEAVTQTQAKKNVVHAIKQVAKQLGNQPSACRKYYIHPAILQSYMEGDLVAKVQAEFNRLQRKPQHIDPIALQSEEKVMLSLLKTCE
jgi:DNA topoisomerase-1